MSSITMHKNHEWAYTPVNDWTNPNVNWSPVKRKGTIEVGSVVRLRSGGPEMTVVMREGNHADCFWICDHKQPCNFILPIPCLEFVR